MHDGIGVESRIGAGWGRCVEAYRQKRQKKSVSETCDAIAYYGLGISLVWALGSWPGWSGGLELHMVMECCSFFSTAFVLEPYWKVISLVASGDMEQNARYVTRVSCRVVSFAELEA